MEDFGTIIVVLALAGSVAGFLSGLMGIGGGIVMIPFLYYAFTFFGVQEAWVMHVTVATALGIIIPTSLVSALFHNKRGAVDFEIAKTWIPWLVTGAIFGTMVAADVNSNALVFFFSVMATLMGLKLVLPLDHITVSKTLPGREITGGIGLFIGTASSMMGIGGATFSVPTLMLFNIPIHRAIGTASFMGVFLSAFAVVGFIVGGWGIAGLPDHSVGFVNLVAVLIVAPISSFMAPLGVKVAHRLPRRPLSIIFGLFLIAAALRMAYPIFGV